VKKTLHLKFQVNLVSTLSGTQGTDHVCKLLWKGKSLNTLETMDVPQASWIASLNETI
jgi:hypothetical protein